MDLINVNNVEKDFSLQLMVHVKIIRTVFFTIT